MTAQLVTFDFQSHAIPFTQDAFVNLTEMCAAFGKRPGHFLELESTRRFLIALAADTGLSCESNCRESRQLKGALVTTAEGRQGGGTWAHPDLALECARWLSPEFAIWTNRTIRKLLSGECLHSAQDVRALARMECRLKELSADMSQLRTRMTKMTHVEGNVSVWAYLQAAKLELDRMTCMRVARESRWACLNDSLPIGSVKQRNVGSRAGWNVNRTFPPAVLCRVLCALGFTHREPALRTILSLWQPMLMLTTKHKTA